MRKLSLVLLSALVPLSSLPALADGLTITVTPFLASNVYGNATTYNAQAQNAVAAQQAGDSSYGAAGPTQFVAQSNINSAQGIVTNFTSYMGVANPSGAYASQYGNRMTFAVTVNDNGGAMFSLSQLSFSMSSTDDPYDYFDGVGHPAGFYNYGQNYVGEIFNSNGTITYVTSGPNTQLVDAVFGVGSGASFEADCTGCTTDQEQAAINAVAAYPGFPYTVSGTYSIGSVSGTGTFNVTPFVATTPEPSSLALLGTGVLSVVGVVRRRYSRL